MNPCACWNLKDGGMAVGFWTMTFSLVELALMAWQTSVISYCQDQLPRAIGYMTPCIMITNNCPCTTSTTFQKLEQTLQGVFIMQIMNLGTMVFLLAGSCCLLFGIQQNSRWWLWVWMPSAFLSIFSLTAYSIVWWAGYVDGYWVALTVIAMFGAIINCYCFLAVVALYKAMGSAEEEYDRYLNYPQQEDYNNYPTKHVTYHYGRPEIGTKGAYPYDDEEVAPLAHSSPRFPHKHGHHLINYEDEPYGKTSTLPMTDHSPPESTEAPPAYNVNAEPLPEKLPILDDPPCQQDNVPLIQPALPQQTTPTKQATPQERRPLIIPSPGRRLSDSSEMSTESERDRHHKGRRYHKSRDKRDDDDHRRHHSHRHGSSRDRKHKSRDDRRYYEDDQSELSRAHHRYHSESDVSRRAHRRKSSRDRDRDRDRDYDSAKEIGRGKHRRGDRKYQDRDRAYESTPELLDSAVQAQPNVAPPVTWANMPSSITIPQHIVIPPSADNKARNYQISSEIVINYTGGRGMPESTGMVTLAGLPGKGKAALPPPIAAERDTSRTTGSQSRSVRV